MDTSVVKLDSDPILLSTESLLSGQERARVIWQYVRDEGSSPTFVQDVSENLTALLNRNPKSALTLIVAISESNRELAKSLFEKNGEQITEAGNASSQMQLRLLEIALRLNDAPRAVDLCRQLLSQADVPPRDIASNFEFNPKIGRCLWSIILDANPTEQLYNSYFSFIERYAQSFQPDVPKIFFKLPDCAKAPCLHHLIRAERFDELKQVIEGMGGANLKEHAKILEGVGSHLREVGKIEWAEIIIRRLAHWPRESRPTPQAKPPRITERQDVIDRIIKLDNDISSGQVSERGASKFLIDFASVMQRQGEALTYALETKEGGIHSHLALSLFKIVRERDPLNALRLLDCTRDLPANSFIVKTRTRFIIDWLPVEMVGKAIIDSTPGTVSQRLVANAFIDAANERNNLIRDELWKGLVHYSRAYAECLCYALMQEAPRKLPIVKPAIAGLISTHDQLVPTNFWRSVQIISRFVFSQPERNYGDIGRHLHSPEFLSLLYKPHQNWLTSLRYGYVTWDPEPLLEQRKQDLGIVQWLPTKLSNLRKLSPSTFAPAELLEMA